MQNGNVLKNRQLSYFFDINALLVAHVRIYSPLNKSYNENISHTKYIFTQVLLNIVECLSFVQNFKLYNLSLDNVRPRVGLYYNLAGGSKPKVGLLVHVSRMLTTRVCCLYKVITKTNALKYPNTKP